MTTPNQPPMPPPPDLGAAAPPQPTPIPTAPKTSRDLDDVALDALEAASAKASAEWVETRDYLRVQFASGRFDNVPARYAQRNWVFAVCGLKGDPKAEARLADLLGKGYFMAPSGVRAAGYERYGDRVNIICCPPETARNIIADKNLRGAVRRERLRKSSVAEIEAKLRAGLPRGAEVSFTPVIGHGNMASLDKEIAAIKRDAHRR